MFPLILSMHIPFNSFYAQPLLNALKEKKSVLLGIFHIFHKLHILFTQILQHGGSRTQKGVMKMEISKHISLYVTVEGFCCV